jgi:uncharacterized protein (DUF697 family)
LLLAASNTNRAACYGWRQRAVAEKIVERYKLNAALGGLSALPVVTAAGVTAVILRMVILLSNRYQVLFERDRTRSIIAGLMGVAVPVGLGVATASTLAFALPGAASSAWRFHRLWLPRLQFTLH